MYVGTDRRIADHFGRPIYLECKKTSQCTLAYINCNSCSVLQREYLMRSRCVAYLLSASELFLLVYFLRKWWKTTCSFGKEPLLVWSGCDGTDSVGHDLTRDKRQLFSQLLEGVPSTNEIAVYIDERCVFNESVSAHNRLAILYCCVAAAISLCITAPVETKFLKEHTQFDPASFSRCHLDRVLLNAVATCPPVMFMITASHMQRWHSWMVCVLTGGT